MPHVIPLGPLSIFSSLEDRISEYVLEKAIIFKQSTAVVGATDILTEVFTKYTQISEHTPLQPV